MDVSMFIRNECDTKYKDAPLPLVNAIIDEPQHDVIEISNDEGYVEDSEEDSDEDREEESDKDSEDWHLDIHLYVTPPKLEDQRFIYGLNKYDYKCKMNIPIELIRNHVRSVRKRLYVYVIRKQTCWWSEYVPRNNARGVMKKGRLKMDGSSL
ncbi:hypothetical protein GH714_012109 [Hevea brasiliensis]|uniref:Uncharacterized protein n=1 Tax=Hevea brasiliensis TaxID=3981 RepID=A0A6A6KQZ7_HEVBR|nr:hypothetical protein GH714_012109 [Hevea brasiliensis]